MLNPLTFNETISLMTLSGQCDIKVKIHVPEGTLLAEPLSEDCVWRQARGAAAEISAPALAAASVEKACEKVNTFYFSQLYFLKYIFFIILLISVGLF